MSVSLVSSKSATSDLLRSSSVHTDKTQRVSISVRPHSFIIHTGGNPSKENKHCQQTLSKKLKQLC